MGYILNGAASRNRTGIFCLEGRCLTVKTKAALGIELMVINTSEQGKFTPKSSEKYYLVIKEQIENLKGRVNY